MSISSGTQNAAKIFSIFGIPPVNSVTEALILTSIYGPASELYDITDLRTDLNAALDAAVAIVVTEIETELGYWDTIRANPELRISQEGGASGVLADYQRREEVIRQRIANYLGFFVPEGGFVYGKRAQTNRMSR